MPLRSITVADGLSQGMVFDMLQDKEGFIWVATKNGLNRYDGYNFKTFYAQPGRPHTLQEDNVTALCEDSRGRIWAGTYSKGIHLYDKHTQRFYQANIQAATAPLSPDSIINPTINKIEETPDGNIWLCTTGGQVIRLVLAPSLSQGYPSQPNFTRQLTATTMAIMGNISAVRPPGMALAQGRQWLWLFSNGPLARLDYTTGKLSQQPYFAGTRLPTTGTVGLLALPDSSWVVNKADSVFLVKNGNTSLAFGTSPRQRTRYRVDAGGNLWFIQGDTLHRLPLTNPGERRSVVISRHNNEFFTQSLTDRQGNVWLGTNGFGLKKWTPGQNRFLHAMAGQSIWHVYEDRQGRVFFWDFASASLLNKATGIKSGTDPLPQYQKLAKGRMTQARNGSFWWVLRSHSEKEALLVHLDSNLRTLQEYRLGLKTVYSRSFVMEDKSGNIWIGGATKGLVCFYPATGQHRFFSYSHLLPPGGQQAKGVISMYEDAAGTIWACTEEGLLQSIWQNGQTTFRLYKNNPGKTGSLPTNQVTSVVDDPLQPHRYLWVATHGGGICKLDKANGGLQNFTVKDGLPSNNVVGILTDQRQHIWLSTYRGLAQLNPATMAFTHYSEKDGLQADEFNTGVFCKNSRGGLLFGGINGLSLFTPTAAWQPASTGQVRIVALKINNQPAETAPGEDSLLPQAIEYLPRLRLSHHQNQLSFEFTTLDMANPAKIRYRHQLEGIDKQWVESGTSRFANYAQLPPGQYTLRVAASADGATYNSPAAQLRITIYPPWYNTWWAYTLYAMLLAALAYWAYLVKIRRVRLQAQLAYGQKEAIRLQELDQLKTQFFTNISHELRTPLAMILGPVDDLQKKYPGDGALDLLGRSAARLLALINQLLDLGKLEAGEMRLELRMYDMAAFIDVLAASFAPLAASRQIAFTLTQNQRQAPRLFDSDKLEKILTNLLSNALKFTPAGKLIHLEVSYAPDNVSMVLQDEGCGIAPADQDRIFNRFYQARGRESHGGTGIGLALVKELVGLHGGHIAVESTVGAGTTFFIALPITQDAAIHTGAVAPPLNLLPFNNLQHHQNGDIQSGNRPTYTLLVVEDDDELRLYIHSLFSPGYTVALAKNGMEGLEAATSLVPDIIITDLMMPQMDGMELCGKIKTNEATSHIPVVMLTAKTSGNTRVGSLELGADDYITKPFLPEELRARVRNLLAGRERLKAIFSKSVVEFKPEELEVVPADQQFLEKLRDIVEKNLADHTFDVNRFAAGLNITVPQLRRKLKTLTGYTPLEFLRRYRLQRAAQLLRQKAGNVSETAFAVGFENLSYFTKVFQEEFGVLPSEYGSKAVSE